MRLDQSFRKPTTNANRIWIFDILIPSWIPQIELEAYTGAALQKSSVAGLAFVTAIVDDNLAA